MKKQELINISELSQTERERLSSLEVTAMQIYLYRSQMYQYWDDVSPYLTKQERQKRYVKTSKEGDKPVYEDQGEEIVEKRTNWKYYAKLSDEQLEKELKRITQKIEREHASESEEDIEVSVEDILFKIRSGIEFFKKSEALGGNASSELQLPAGLVGQFRYRKFQREQIASARRRMFYLLDEIKKKERKIASAKSKRNAPEIIQKAYTEFKNAQKQFEAFRFSSPEAFFVYFSEELAYARMIAQTNFTETPYTNEIAWQIKEQQKEGVPCYVHGHYGSGKTEFSMHLMRSDLCKPYLSRWMIQHSPPKELYPAFNAYLAGELTYAKWFDIKEKEKNKSQDNKALSWIKDYEMAIEPVFFSGNPYAEPSDLAGGLRIVREKSLASDVQVDIISSKLLNYEVPEKLKGTQDEQKLKDALIKIEQQLLSSPVQTREIAGPLMQAMQEGRPLLIDEMDYIPSQVLGAFNGVLGFMTKLSKLMPDETLLFPNLIGEGYIEVKPGFYIIGTGNSNPFQPDERYIGRAGGQMDTAAVSRWKPIKFSYPFNSMETGSLLLDAKQTDPEKTRMDRPGNHLYHLLVMPFLDKNFGIKAPKGSIENVLWSFSVVAKIIQAIYSRDASIMNNSNFFPKSILKKDTTAGTDLESRVNTVSMSLRLILPIIKNWIEDGFEMPFDAYLFNALRSHGDLKERAYIYGLFQSIGGFFTAKEGLPWLSINDKEFNVNPGGKLDQLFETRLEPKHFKKRNKEPLEYYDVTKLMQFFYGIYPERKQVSADVLKDTSKETAEMVKVYLDNVKMLTAKFDEEPPEERFDMTNSDVRKMYKQYSDKQKEIRAPGRKDVDILVNLSVNWDDDAQRISLVEQLRTASLRDASLSEVLTVIESQNDDVKTKLSEEIERRTHTWFDIISESVKDKKGLTTQQTVALNKMFKDLSINLVQIISSGPAGWETWSKSVTTELKQAKTYGELNAAMNRIGEALATKGTV